MKQEKHKKLQIFKTRKVILLKLILGCLVFGSFAMFFLLCTDKAKALDINDPSGGYLTSIHGDSLGAGLSYIGVNSPTANKLSWTNITKSLEQWGKNFLLFTSHWKDEGVWATAWKNAFGQFLKRMAYDTATYLATGDKGQAPMFQTDNLGDFISNAADNAAGDFLETLGKSNDWGEFNLCNPSLAVKAQINIGILNSRRPKKPACTFSEMLNNWDAELSDPNFLNNFQDMFNPWSNDFGIALTVQSGVEQKASQEYSNALNTWMKNTFKPVTDKISGKTKTPAAMVENLAKKAVNESDKVEGTFTNSPVADAIGVFTNTLIAKLINQWFSKGLVSNFPDNSYNWNKLSGLYDYNAGSSKGGINSAKERFRTLVEPQFKERGNYDILGELVSCPDPSKAGPTNCVITDNFKQAINNKMTVGEAMGKGYLNPAGVFGFLSGSDPDEPPEPNYYEGYPYRSMIILRKFRILPVGWELAAEYIKDHQQEEEVNGTKNLEDLVNCYSRDDNYGEGDEDWASWCEGLVDPNWVLKAPLNYCRREGPGPEIMSEEISGQGDDSQLNISRNDNYCADEQTCIVEGEGNSCDYYGYCTEERRKWDFNAKSCDSKYNTCNTFRGRDGQTASYLENTLDFSGCTPDNVGCLGYCEDYNYAASTFSCTSIGGDKVYLDSGVEACSQSEEGCHEFIRTKTGLGANLLHNSSLEDDTDLWPELTGILVEDDAYHGQNSYQISPGLNKTVEAGPAGNSLEAKSLTLSLYAKNCNDGDAIYLENTDTASTLIMSGSDWQFYQVTYLYPLGFSGNQVTFGVSLTGVSCQIDAVKLEFGSSATVYSDYRGNGLTYLKLAPDYLNCNGTDDPAECDDYIRYCSAYDEGCNMFTSLTDGMSVPAKVISSDYCPAECVGYDEYLQTETYFDDPGTADFIPKMAKKCSSQSVGCDEFTNLDKLGEGAEAREYYKELKQCRKPDASCAEFYTWEGSAETGYQLKVYSLEADALTDGPYLTNSGTYNGLTCNDSADYDTVYNPMCREFYNKSGEVFYRFYPYVVTCSDNCHPYRRTDKNIDPGITAQGNLHLCSDPSSDGDAACWDNVEAAAYSCKNGGVWNYQHEACIYNAIPGQGLACQAEQAGCREYSGNAGANMRVLFTDTFEFGTTDNWEGNLAVVNPSNESLIVGQHSLSADGTTIYKTVGNLVNIDKNYVLSFLAKSNAANSFAEIGFGSSIITGVSIPFALGTANLSSEWRLYEFNLPNLNNASGDYEVSPTEKIFIISNNSDFYVDNIRLTEISDRYYLIKNNWNLPDACLHDVNGNSVSANGPDSNIGCDAYRDQNNETYYLKSFSHLCSDSAVGCELMIDTHNYSDYAGNTFNSGDPAEEIVPADNYTYVVYDRNKRCNAVDKGCQLLGEPHQYQNEVVYHSLYYKNDPDKYAGPGGNNYLLCLADAEDCEAYTTAVGPSYFKNPGEQTCEWRQGSSADGSYAWFKKKVKFCDSDGDGLVTSSIDTFCVNNEDCTVGQECLVDNNDYSCTIDSLNAALKTIGTGGAGSRVVQPAGDANGNWTGLCPAAEAGCSEYIDPISKFSTNIIFNPNFSDIDLNGNSGDGWESGKQIVKVAPYTLYRFAGKSNSNNLFTLHCVNNFYELRANNKMGTAISTITLNVNTDFSSKLLYIGNNDTCDITAATVRKSDVVELKEAVVDYQLNNTVDRAGCNGQVDFEKGCVLFNERVYNDSSLAVLPWDADLTINDGQGMPPVSVSNGQQDSNLILKVSQDRSCKQWLACRSYIKGSNKENVCYNIGLCDSVNENGECDSFPAVPFDRINYSYLPAYFSLIQNFSGYSVIGNNLGSLNKDYFHLASMKQDGEIAKISNGNFELYGSNKYPLGWRSGLGDWNESKFRVIDNPVAAQTEGISYPAEGKSFLKYAPAEDLIMTDGSIEVEPNTDYIASFKVNTKNFTKPGTSLLFSVVVTDSTARKIPEPANGDIFQGLSACDDCALPWREGTSVGSAKIYGVPALAIIPHSLGWQNITVRFKTAPGGKNLILGFLGLFVGKNNKFEYCSNASAADLCLGNVYIDDIKLMPVLELKDKTPLDNNDNSYLYSSQSCRLYPKTNSLSCDYFDDSGKEMKGQKGYCLEYDRSPGNPDTCLLWYPIDRVKGDGIQEGGGYQDKYPLYYSISSEIRPTDFYGSKPILFESSFEPDIVTKEFSLEDMGINNFDYLLNISDINTITLKCPRRGLLHPLNHTKEINLFRKGEECFARSDSILVGYDNDHNQADDNPPLVCRNLSSVYDSDQNIINDIKVCNRTDCLVSYWIIDNGKITGLKYFVNDTDADHSDQNCTLVFNVDNPVATRIAQVVTPIGRNKFWSGRVFKGSNYSLPCNIGIPGIYTSCDYNSDNTPFGSITPPGDTWNVLSNPYEWDSEPEVEGTQPLYYKSPDTNEPRMGQLYTEDGLKHLFAQSYASYAWLSVCAGGPNDGLKCYEDNLCEAPENRSICADPTPGAPCVCDCAVCDPDLYRYRSSGTLWSPPKKLCRLDAVGPGCTGSAGACSIRPDNECYYCGVRPQIKNIAVNNQVNGKVVIHDTGFINLTFNSEVDSQQLPLVMYSVDWGDKEKTTISGVEMLHRPNNDKPHSLYHVYSYWDLKIKAASGIPGINCNNNFCEITPKVKIKDNWGWCNAGEDNNICPDVYQAAVVTVIVARPGVDVSSEGQICTNTPCDGTCTLGCPADPDCVPGGCVGDCVCAPGEAGSHDCGSAAPPPAAPSCSLSWNPAGPITAPGSSSANLSSTNATEAMYNCTGPLPGSGGWGSIPVNASIPFSFAAGDTGTENCTVTVRNSSGVTNTCNASLVVNSSAGSPPTNASLTINDETDITVLAGQIVTFILSANGTVTEWIANGSGLGANFNTVGTVSLGAWDGNPSIWTTPVYQTGSFHWKIQACNSFGCSTTYSPEAKLKVNCSTFDTANKMWVDYLGNPNTTTNPTCRQYCEWQGHKVAGIWASHSTTGYPTCDTADNTPSGDYLSASLYPALMDYTMCDTAYDSAGGIYYTAQGCRCACP